MLNASGYRDSERFEFNIYSKQFVMIVILHVYQSIRFTVVILYACYKFGSLAEILLHSYESVNKIIANTIDVSGM